MPVPSSETLGAPYCLQRGISPLGKALQASLWGRHAPWAHAVSDCELSLLLALIPGFPLIVSAFPDTTHLSIFNYKIIYLLFLPHREACGILVPQEGIEPGPKQ